MPRLRSASRVRLGRHLTGSGLELGPGGNPFPIGPGVSVAYVDRWEPDENERLFPEVFEHGSFPQPDIVANLDVERLSMIDSGSQDFVIASHILEHMANPIAMLMEVQRVLRPGGVALIVLPDRTRTFDRDRDPTPLAHLVAEYRSDVHEADEAHLIDFLVGTGSQVHPPGPLRDRHFEKHRLRSFHVHCWSQDEFAGVVAFTMADLGASWTLVDGYGTAIDEFGFVLRKAPSAPDGFTSAWRRTIHPPGAGERTLMRLASALRTRISSLRR